MFLENFKCSSMYMMQAKVRMQSPENDVLLFTLASKKTPCNKNVGAIFSSSFFNAQQASKEIE